ncbi:MAG: TetR/AcrR family transcriptional regulator [Acidimicrobiales bacterium]
MGANEEPGAGPSPAPHANTRVGKEQWTRAALEAIAEEGVAGVKVEALARQLGITKGSFYWHFRDRAELIEAALEQWYRLGTAEIIERLDRIEDPEHRLRALFTESFGDLVSGPIDALLLGQVDDSVVGPVVVRCTSERLRFLTRTYRELGVPSPRATARARLVYAAYLGTGHLRRVPGLGTGSPGEESAFEKELELLLSV